MNLCPVCFEHSVEKHPIYGILPCLNCKARRDNLKSPDHLVEFTTDSIRQGRKEYARDIIQPFRGNEASKEFMDAYPEKAKKIYNKKEIKNIKNVWT